MKFNYRKIPLNNCWWWLETSDPYEPHPSHQEEREKLYLSNFTERVIGTDPILSNESDFSVTSDRELCRLWQTNLDVLHRQQVSTYVRLFIFSFLTRA